MSCVEITDADFDDMHHALGRPSLNVLALGGHYRNFYATEAGSDWALRAERTGFWVKLSTDGERLAVYRVNNDGMSALADWLSLKTGDEDVRR